MFLQMFTASFLGTLAALVVIALLAALPKGGGNK